MEAPYPLKIVSNWRIQDADPEGLTMWFDPAYEVPLLGVLPPEQRRDDEVIAYRQVELELSEGREVVPLEGGAVKVSDEYIECFEGGPPQSFLDALWEGYDG